MSVSYKVGDTSPPLTATLQDANGVVDLTGATVRLHLRRLKRKQVHLDTAVTVIDAPAGRVRYDWKPTDLDVEGAYQVEWLASWPDGSAVTFPNDSYGELVVRSRLS